jgi:hypothetical protein
VLKKKQKENKNKQTERKQKKIAEGNIEHKPGMSHYIPRLIAE